MQALLGVGIVIGAVLMLCLLAYVIRKVLVWFAARKGYTANNMPILYHFIGFGVYFSILMLVHAIYLTVARG
jgi:hypothetical protein